jgi:hypothetical protein
MGDCALASVGASTTSAAATDWRMRSFMGGDLSEEG